MIALWFFLLQIEKELAILNEMAPSYNKHIAWIKNYLKSQNYQTLLTRS